MLYSAVHRVLQGWVSDPAGAASQLNALLRTARPPEIVQLERDYRARRSSLAFAVGATVDVFEPFAQEHRPAVAALLTLDWSGYLREAGVRWLAGVDDMFVVPFLLLRTNDVVEPVREKAISAVRQWLGPGHAGLWARLLPVVGDLGRRRRAGEFSRAIENLLLGDDPAARGALWDGVRNGDSATRAGCLRLLARVEPVGAVEFAVATGEPALRHWAAAVATAPSLDTEAQRRLLPLLERDRNPRIRWRALRARARLPDREPQLRRALLDPDARVRYLARVSLRALGHTGSVQLYRDTLDTGAAEHAATVGALAGLADMGGSEDVRRVLRFLDDANARVRTEAWRALATLAPDAYRTRVDRLRADPSGKVRRLAVRGATHRA